MINFRSDNEAPVAPEIFDALTRANAGTAPAYGADAVTARLDAQFSELFETEVTVFPVATGTAANALSIAQLCPPYGAVYCHAGAHIHVDECGAPEFFSGGAKLMPLASADGKMPVAALRDALDSFGAHGDHESLPAVLSLTQATEAGTVYSLDHVRDLTALARRHRMNVHMDGARFANALVHLKCAPADVTWRAGVDVLSFGATKNGAMAAEAVVVFRPELVDGLGRQRMRGGHLFSKMRYLSAQLEAYIADGVWLGLAAQANRSASRLAEGISALPGCRLVNPPAANEVFAVLPAVVRDGLAADGFAFHPWAGEPGTVRLICSYATTDDQIDEFLARARHHVSAPVRTSG